MEPPPDMSFRANAVSRGIHSSCRFYLVVVHYSTWWIPPLRWRYGRNDSMGGHFLLCRKQFCPFRCERLVAAPWLSLWESWLGAAETERAVGRFLNDNVPCYRNVYPLRPRLRSATSPIGRGKAYPPTCHSERTVVSRGIFPSCLFYLVVVLHPTWWIPPFHSKGPP